MSEIKFANGLIFKRSDNAPEFVIGGLSIKKSEFIPFLNSEQGDWVNLSIKLSKAGKYYIELDTWKPKVKNNIPDVAPSDNSDWPF